ASTSAQTATATTATFTAVVAHVNRAAGTISLRQTLPAKPTAASTVNTASPTATADYQVSPPLLNTATVGATVQATVPPVHPKPTGGHHCKSRLAHGNRRLSGEPTAAQHGDGRSDRSGHGPADQRQTDGYRSAVVVGHTIVAADAAAVSRGAS